jgi:hypothetical protein
MDDQRGHCGPWANDVYQRCVFQQVQEFIGPTTAVVATDAGSIKTDIPPTPPTVDGLRSGIAALDTALAQVNLGRQEMLLGVDGCVCGQTTHLQTVVHLQGQVQLSLSNTTVKVYPTADERPSLVGWRICNSNGGVPKELTIARRVRTAAGMVLVLVCNDGAVFSARSRSNLGNSLGLAIRRHFMDQLLAEPRPEYVLIATHWQGTNPKTDRWSGEAFRQAADYLANQSGATVVTTLRAPMRELSEAACRFCVVGPRADKVATLLVKDTP